MAAKQICRKTTMSRCKPSGMAIGLWNLIDCLKSDTLFKIEGSLVKTDYTTAFGNPLCIHRLSDITPLTRMMATNL
jgi:hypothetical protein